MFSSDDPPQYAVVSICVNDLNPVIPDGGYEDHVRIIFAKSHLVPALIRDIKTSNAIMYDVSKYEHGMGLDNTNTTRLLSRTNNTQTDVDIYAYLATNFYRMPELAKYKYIIWVDDPEMVSNPRVRIYDTHNRKQKDHLRSVWESIRGKDGEPLDCSRIQDGSSFRP